MSAPPHVARNLLEAEAKIAYEVFAHRTGATTPWEHLSLNEWQAWKEVINTIEELEQDGPECECGRMLMCPDCDTLECPKCCQDLICAHCAKLAEEEETARKVSDPQAVQGSSQPQLSE
jgi:hypothetical protein